MKIRLFVILIVCLCLAFSSGCADSSTDTYPEPIIETSNEVYIDNTESNAVCYFDFKTQTMPKISDEFEADSGYHYMVVTVYIKNAAEDYVSTNPFYWEFVSDGVSYSPDEATYDDSIHHHTDDVEKGEELESMFVFQVPTSSTEGHLSYSGFLAPTLEEIQYY